MIVPVLQGFSTQNLDMIPAICKLNHRLLMHSIVRNQIFHLFRRKLFQYWPCKKHQHIMIYFEGIATFLSCNRFLFLHSSGLSPERLNNMV